MDWARVRRQFLGDLFGDEEGSTTAAVVASIRRVVLRSMGLWQLVMVPTVLIEPLSPAGHTTLLVIHLGLLAISFVAAADRLPSWVVVVLAYVAFVADWAWVTSLDQPLLLAACWLANLAAALPSFAMRGRAALLLPLAVAVVVPTAMVLTWPDSGSVLPTSVATTGLAILVGTRIGYLVLLDFARRADEERALAETQEHAVEVRQAASRRAAEDARVLHDTVINTLGALANGGAGVADLKSVRARCARDVATVEALTGDARLPMDGHGIRSGLHVDGIRVVHRGVPDEELARREALLPPEVLQALARATTELVRNAAKHSGADEVVVDVAVRDGGLVVTVSDDGVGFDGHVPTGRGLAESVLGRFRGTDVEVSLVTAPGEGTRATLVWTGRAVPDGPGVVPDREDALQAVVDGLQRRASGLFAVGVVVIGVWLAVTNHRGRPTEEYPMVAIVALVCAIAWQTNGPGRVRAVLLPVVLAVGASLAFVLSAAAVDFGRHDIVLWQAICPTGPLLVLLGDRRWRKSAGWAGASVLATVLAVAAVTARSDTSAAASVLVAGTACLGLAIGWAGFQRLVTTVGRQVVTDQEAAARLRTEADARDAASRARRRWAAAGLGESVAILDRVARAEADPRDEQLQRACAEEETYLRQLTQLNPDLVRMGEWFARGLADARTAQTRLAVRSGGVDVDAAVAPALGELLLTAVAAVPAGEQLTSTLFPGPDALRFTLVGPGPRLSSALQGWHLPDGVELSVRNLGPQDLVEVVVPSSEGDRS